MIKIGILGCADIADRLLIPNMKSSGNFDVVAVSSRTRRKAELFSNKFSCEAIVGYDKVIERSDIDAVYIPLPIALHYEWVKKSLLAEKHVFVEKSFTSTEKEAKELISIAEKEKLCVFENFMFPFHSQVAFAKSLLKNNEIGEMKLLRSSFGFPPFRQDTNIRYKANLGGGALLDAGAYTLMAAQLFLGFKQDVMSAALEKNGNEVDFHGYVALKSEKGVYSQLAFGFDNFYQNNIEIWGSSGKLTMERAFTAGPGFSPRVILEQQNKRTEFMIPPDNHFINILDMFYSSIVNEKYNYNYDQILNQAKLMSEVRNLNSVK